MALISLQSVPFREIKKKKKKLDARPRYKRYRTRFSPPMGRFETSRDEVSRRSDTISVIIVIKIYVITGNSPAIYKGLKAINY